MSVGLKPGGPRGGNLEPSWHRVIPPRPPHPSVELSEPPRESDLNTRLRRIAQCSLRGLSTETLQESHVPYGKRCVRHGLLWDRMC